jgi:glycosyltransferase involved in cell wall biosynthesis
VLNQFALPPTSAGGTRHVELFSRLVGWDALVVAGSRELFSQERIRPDGVLVTVPVTRYSGNGISRVVNWASYAAGAMFKGLVARRPSVVYGSSPQMGAAFAALVIARIRRARFVLEIRDLWPHILAESGTLSPRSGIYRALKALERLLYRHADAIVVLAEGSIEPIVAEGGARERITFIPNGADPSLFAVTRDRASLRAEFGFDGFVVVYAGAHGPANGLDFVLDAADALRDIPVVTFVLVGNGVEKARLADAAARRGLTNLEFRPPVPKQRIPEVLAAADAGLHCLADLDLFRSAVSPNKLYDYIAAGLPSITNTMGAVAEMVEASGAGIATAPSGIADGIRTLLAMSDEERAALGAAGRAFIEAHRSRDAMARRLEGLLDSVVSEPRKR